MSRSKWKFQFVDASFRRKLKGEINIHNTWSRRTTILPAAVGKILKIHDGQKMIEKEISQSMVGFKIGEFARTRQVYVPKVNKVKNKKK